MAEPVVHQLAGAQTGSWEVLVFVAVPCVAIVACLFCPPLRRWNRWSQAGTFRAGTTYKTTVEPCAEEPPARRRGKKRA